jgi:hypothetical protein
MRIERIHVLGGILAVLTGYFLWQWVTGWGLISVDFRDVPVAKAIPILEKQSGKRILTNADPDARLTFRVRRAPLYDVLETVAAQTDGMSRIAYVVAKDKPTARAAAPALLTRERDGAVKVFNVPPLGFMGTAPGGAIDMMQMNWNVTEMPDTTLHAVLDQGAQKTGVLFAVPAEWNPTLTALPKSGQVPDVVQRAASAVGGHAEPIHLVTTFRGSGRGGEDRGADDDGPPRGMMGGGGPPNVNPAWIAERAEAQIALLPKNEQEPARRVVGEAMAMFAQVRDLPPDERRAKMMELLQKPEVQEMIEDRMSARDARMTAEQRQRRYKRYIDRKQQVKPTGAPQT